MLNQHTLEKLQALRLVGMAEAVRAQAEQPDLTQLSFEERFALLVDQQWNWKQNRALARRLANAKLRHRASVEDIDFRSPRGLDRALVRSLAQTSGWVGQHQNVFLIGPTGIGKSFLACALAEKACRDGYTALYTRASQLFRDLTLARADGSLRSRFARLAKVDVLVVDDWAMAPLGDLERRDFLEICEDRYQIRSLVLTSQLPLAQWHARSAIRPWPIASWTGWCTTLIGSKCKENRCARNAPERRLNRRRCAPKRTELLRRGNDAPWKAWKTPKAKTSFPLFPPGLEIRQKTGAPDSHISTAPAAGDIRRRKKSQMAPQQNSS